MNCEICDRRPGTHYLSLGDRIFYGEWAIMDMSENMDSRTKILKYLINREVWICSKCPYSSSQVIEFYRKIVKKYATNIRTNKGIMPASGI